MKRYWLGPVVLAGLIGVAGCGAGYSKVEGVVQYEDGSPVEGATVDFSPEAGGAVMPTGVTDAQGKFTLKSGNVDGAKKGKYKVLISKVPAQKVKDGSPSGKEAIELMKKNMGKGGGKGPMVMPPGKGGKSKSQNELDEKYSSPEKTPYTEEVPTKGPVTYKVKKR